MLELFVIVSDMGFMAFASALLISQSKQDMQHINPSPLLIWDMFSDSGCIPPLPHYYTRVAFVIDKGNNLIFIHRYLKFISPRPLSTAARVRDRAIPCGIYGGKSEAGTILPPESSGFPSASLYKCYMMIFILKAVLNRRTNERIPGTCSTF
jgi:hypothetical protein